jgi:hypothetical protein
MSLTWIGLENTIGIQVITNQNVYFNYKATAYALITMHLYMISKIPERVSQKFMQSPEYSGYMVKKS